MAQAIQIRNSKQDGPIEFPLRCVICDGAGEVLTSISRIFERGKGENYRQVVHRHTPWMCSACAAQHRAEQLQPGLGHYISRLWGGEGAGITGMFIALFSLYFFNAASEDFFWFNLCIAALFLGAGALLVRFNWRRRAHVFVGPDTPSTASFKFSDTVSEQHDEPVMTFRFRSSRNAEEFRQLNNKRLWDPASGEALVARQKKASREKRQRWAVMFAVVAVAIAVVLSLLIQAFDL